MDQPCETPDRLSPTIPATINAMEASFSALTESPKNTTPTTATTVTPKPAQIA